VIPASTPDVPTNGNATIHLRRSLDVKDIRVGRYVVQQDSPEWLVSATDFMTNLQLATTLGRDVTFIDEQYLGADPTMFISDKNQFVNSVEIALTEAHGDWGEFSLYKSFGDIVHITDIGAAGGLGETAGGNLSYWILHSCQVIPTQTDEPNSFDIWWDVFQGLHSAIGYRVDMYVSDNVTSNFGLWTGLGASLIPAWFVEVAANNLYGVSTAVNFNPNRGIVEPLGRASAVSVCGHLDDTVNDLEGLGPAKCLKEVWLDN